MLCAPSIFQDSALSRHDLRLALRRTYGARTEAGAPVTASLALPDVPQLREGRDAGLSGFEPFSYVQFAPQQRSAGCVERKFEDEHNKGIETLGHKHFQNPGEIECACGHDDDLRRLFRPAGVHLCRTVWITECQYCAVACSKNHQHRAEAEQQQDKGGDGRPPTCTGGGS
jgi:hypothetical protein